MANGTASPRRRLDPGARRDQLLALGLDLIKSRPFDQLLIDEVIAAAGISKGLLFHYFPSKRDFQVKLMEAAAGELLAAIEPDPDADVLTQLHQGLEAYIGYIERSPAAYIAIVRGAGSDDALLEVFEGTRDRIVELIVGRIVAAGLVVDANPLLRLAARGFIASVEESTILWLRERPCSREELVQLFLRAAYQLAPMVNDISANDINAST